MKIRRKRKQRGRKEETQEKIMIKEKHGEWWRIGRGRIGKKT